MQNFQGRVGHNLDCLTKLGTSQKLQNVSICINSLPEISVHFLDCSEAWFKSPRDHNAQKNRKNHQNVQKWIIFWSTWILETKSETQLFVDLKKSASQTDKIPSNHQSPRARKTRILGTSTHGRISKNRQIFVTNKQTLVFFQVPCPHTIASLRDN